MIRLKNFLFLFLRLLLKFVPHELKKGIQLDLNVDRILARNYPAKTPFSFIQVGGLDGKSFDTLYDFVKHRNSAGLIIEPLPDYFEKLKDNYSYNNNIQLVNKAVHPHLKEITLYRVDPAKANELPDWAIGIASIDKQHHKRSGIDEKYILPQTCVAEHLMVIVKDFAFRHCIDLFQCDVEGFDGEVLKMINFNKLAPLILKFEYVNLTNHQIYDAKQLLKQQGYFCFYQYPDLIAVRLQKIAL